MLGPRIKVGNLFPAILLGSDCWLCQLVGLLLNAGFEFTEICDEEENMGKFIRS